MEEQWHNLSFFDKLDSKEYKKEINFIIKKRNIR